MYSYRSPASANDEDMINAKCKEEKELTEAQAKSRRIWSDLHLGKKEGYQEVPGDRPRSKDWKNVSFADEFNFGLGTQLTRWIKRKRGDKREYWPENVHRKRVTSQDVKANV